MKTTSLIFSVIVSLCVGYNLCLSIHDIDHVKSTYRHKTELIKAQNTELEYASKLLAKHNIYDADASELMDKYIQSCCTVDSLLECGM